MDREQTGESSLEAVLGFCDRGATYVPVTFGVLLDGQLALSQGFSSAYTARSRGRDPVLGAFGSPALRQERAAIGQYVDALAMDPC